MKTNILKELELGHLGNEGLKIGYFCTFRREITYEKVVVANAGFV